MAQNAKNAQKTQAQVLEGEEEAQLLAFASELDFDTYLEGLEDAELRSSLEVRGTNICPILLSPDTAHRTTGVDIRNRPQCFSMLNELAFVWA